jgi:hypothetical protein
MRAVPGRGCGDAVWRWDGKELGHGEVEEVVEYGDLRNMRKGGLRRRESEWAVWSGYGGWMVRKM